MAIDKEQKSQLDYEAITKAISSMDTHTKLEAIATIFVTYLHTDKDDERVVNQAKSLCAYLTGYISAIDPEFNRVLISILGGNTHE